MAKILIIDDNRVNRQFLTTLLGYQQHELHEASDGVEGLRIARAFRPDLIITDVLMPTMDGYEFVQQLRKDPQVADTPVVFSTAHYLGREGRALAEKCGIKQMIQKPSEPQEVLDAVAAALSASTVAQPPETAAEEIDREHLRLITNKLADKTGQLFHANEKLTALIELSTELAQERNPAALLHRYCSVARDVIGARWSLLVLLDRNDQKVEHLAAVGLEIEDSATLRSDLHEFGIFKTVINDGRAICLSDGTSTPEDLRLPKNLPRAESLVVAPLSVRGHTYGWICLADKLGFDAFSEQDEALVVAMASKMAVAYDNVSLYADTAKYAARLEGEIAERERVQQNLAESESRLAGIINSAMDAIITIDDNQRIVLFNEAAEKMFCSKASEAIGQSVDRFIPPRFRASHSLAIQRFARSGVTTRIIAPTSAVIGLRADNSEFPFEASISQIEIAGKKLYTVIMRDITERKQAEEELRETNEHLSKALSELQVKQEELATMTAQLWQASKLATMGELAASVAHELNNPLATIGLRAETLLSQVPEDDQKRRSLEVISQEVDRMARLVNNLLQFSRRSHRQISTFDLREEVDNSLDFINYHLRSRRIAVAREFADPLPAIHADRQQLRQLFLNLITNASDAMPNGGTLTVRVSAAALDGVAAVAVDFADTGEGISPENLGKIWEPFFTTKAEGKGTGLGLAICRRIVEEHRGGIHIESEPEQGTVIHLVFPATESEKDTNL